jgi:hypothetical protein
MTIFKASILETKTHWTILDSSSTHCEAAAGNFSGATKTMGKGKHVQEKLA